MLSFLATDPDVVNIKTAPSFSMEHILNGPALWIIVAAASELIALNPKLKSNSIIQLVFQILNILKAKKR